MLFCRCDLRARGELPTPQLLLCRSSPVPTGRPSHPDWHFIHLESLQQQPRSPRSLYSPSSRFLQCLRKPTANRLGPGTGKKKKNLAGLQESMQHLSGGRHVIDNIFSPIAGGQDSCSRSDDSDRLERTPERSSMLRFLPHRPTNPHRALASRQVTSSPLLQQIEHSKTAHRYK